MAGIAGIHVRASVSFMDSPRFLKLSFDAQALWLHLHKYAIREKREFLPPEYDLENIAYFLHKPEDQIASALQELTKGDRPIINTLQDGRIRVRGAREKQPLSWRDESDEAEIWNSENHEDQVDVCAFAQKVVNGQTLARNKDTRTRNKRGANAARTRANANRREENRKENKRSRSERGGAASSLPDWGLAANSDTPFDARVAPEVLEAFEGQCLGWSGPGEDEAKSKAMQILAADPPRVFAYVDEINKKNLQRPWTQLGMMITTLHPIDDKCHDAAKKLIRKIESRPATPGGNGQPVQLGEVDIKAAKDLGMPEASKKKRRK